MILRWTTLFWLVVVGVAVGLVFQVTAAVQDLEAELRATQEEIHRDREAIHVLRAEWSYLNRPERVARLAEELLGMVPLAAPNITQIAALGPKPEFMEGRVFPDGPPVPPRRPAIDAEAWRTALPVPAAAPDGGADPIGDLVASTLAETPRAGHANATPAPPPPPKLPPAETDRQTGERPAVPVNPVTGAPLPVGASFVSEAR